MKKIFVFFLTIIFSQIFCLGYIYAQSNTNVGYIGTDVPTSNNYSNKLGSTISYKPFSLSDVNSTLGINISGQVLDGVNVSQSNGLKVNLLENKDTKIDSLGYFDMLLTLGVYNADIKAINNNTQMSIAEVLQSYADMGNTVDPARVSIFNNELNMYYSMVTQVGSTAKTSLFFFNVERESMDDPDLNLFTNGIIDYSLGRENLKINSDLKNKLYTWEKDLIVKGNTLDGFFREVNIYTTNSDRSISTSYEPLFSSINQIPQADQGQKTAAATIIICFLVLLGFIAYKKKNNT